MRCKRFPSFRRSRERKHEQKRLPRERPVSCSPVLSAGTVRYAYLDTIRGGAAVYVDPQRAGRIATGPRQVVGGDPIRSKPGMSGGCTWIGTSFAPTLPSISYGISRLR